MGYQLPGRVVDLTKAQASEEPMRNLYRRWAQFMEAESWDDLMTWRRNNARGRRRNERIRSMFATSRWVHGVMLDIRRGGGDRVQSPRRRLAVRAISVIGR